MTSILKVDTIQDTDGNNIINESGNTITIGASGDTTNIIGTLQNNGAAVGGTNTPAFQAYRTATQNIGNNTLTKVQFTSENFDTDNLYDNSTNYRFTPNTSGKYMVYSVIQIGATAIDRNGISEIALRENGTTIAVSKMDSRQASSLGGYRFTCSINFIIEPNGSSDYYEIFASCFDNSGADAEVVHDSNGSIVFGAYKIIE